MQDDGGKLNDGVRYGGGEQACGDELYGGGGMGNDDGSYDDDAWSCDDVQGTCDDGSYDDDGS